MVSGYHLNGMGSHSTKGSTPQAKGWGTRKGREESPTSHVIYEIVPQPMTGEQMATTSCSSSFVYHDCLITSLPKRGDFFFFLEPSGRCRHYSLPQEPEKLAQHLGLNLRHKSHERRAVNGKRALIEGIMVQKPATPASASPESHPGSISY